MQPRILVVDDSEDLRAAYVEILGEAGYDVIAVSDGVEAFAEARASRPDLIISDIVMPNLDGFGLIERLRSDLAPPVPPVILCSGFGVAEEEALQRGALMFLRKPFERIDLLDFVAQGLRHERVTGAIAERERRYAQSVRQCTREIASAVVSGMEARAQQLSFADVVAGPLEWLRAYFAFAQADLFLVETGRLRVVAHAGSDATLPDVEKATGLRELQDVVETGSTLVVNDVAHHPCFHHIATALPRASFFAGAPLTLDDGTPVGMVCLADPQPRSFAPQDLTLLQTVAQRGSVLLGALAARKPLGESPVLPRAGVLAHDMLARLIGLELQLLERDGGSMALAVVEDLEEMRAELVAQALRHARVRRRLAAGFLGGGRLAICRRHDDARAAAAGLHEVVDEVMRLRGPAAAVGIVEISGISMPHFDGIDLLRLGELALERAIDDGLKRVLIEVTITGDQQDQHELVVPRVDG